MMNSSTAQTTAFPWQEFLDQNARATYDQALNTTTGRGTAQNRFFQNRFNDVQNQYMASLADFALRNKGQAPSQHFSDYLSQFNFGQEYLNQYSPAERGFNATPQNAYARQLPRF